MSLILELFYSFLLTRDGFLNDCPLKPAVVCQPLSKFGIFNFVASYKIPFIVVFYLNGGASKISGYLVEEHNREKFSKVRGEGGGGVIIYSWSKV